MLPLSQGTQRRSAREITIRNVVDFAHEVRVQLHDSQVIFGSVIPFAGGEVGAFRIRPWGLTLPMAIRFDDVFRAAPIKRMAWQKQQSIAAAQLAGNFRTPTPLARNRNKPICDDVPEAEVTQKAQADLAQADATQADLTQIDVALAGVTQNDVARETVPGDNGSPPEAAG